MAVDLNEVASTSAFMMALSMDTQVAGLRVEQVCFGARVLSVGAVSAAPSRPSGRRVDKRLREDILSVSSAPAFIAVGRTRRHSVVSDLCNTQNVVTAPRPPRMAWPSLRAACNDSRVPLPVAFLPPRVELDAKVGSEA